MQWPEGELILRMFRKIICAALCSVLLFSITSPAHAAGSVSVAQSLEKMTDEYLKKTLPDDHVAGAAVSVVKDGKVLFEKGYGNADLERNVPVDAESTSFQIASVSKVFTATAVMQMVEKGKLSLDKDVNSYLTTFKVNNPFSTPVTLRTLLTHTSGLDFRIPLLVPSSGNLLSDSMKTLESDLKENLPPVIREPGTFCQYNGYGISLAGYLVEIASGEPLDRYITKNILEPLEMNHSSYGLTKSVLPSMAKPYLNLFGRYFERKYTLLSDHPAGSICASASDMANFMLAHLNNGEFNGKRILNSDTAAQMHTHQYPEDGRLAGFTLGFYEAVRDGYKTIEFGGHLPCFSSKVSLLKEKNIGIFIAINTDSAGSGKVCNEYIDLVYKLLSGNRFQEVSSIAAVPFDMDADAISGRYSYSEYGDTDFLKTKSVMVTCKVKCDHNGNLNFSSSDFNWDFYYIGNGMFYCKESGNYCRFSDIGGKQAINILGFDFFKISSALWSLLVLSLISQPVFAVFALILLISLIKNRKRDTGLNRAVKITLMSEAILIISYFSLNALAALLYLIGDTSLVFHAIQPTIPIVCWSCAGLTIVSTVLIGLIWIKNETSLKSKVTLSILIMLFIPNIIFMFLMNGMNF